MVKKGEELIKLDKNNQVIIESKEILREKMKKALSLIDIKLINLRGPQGRPYKTNLQFRWDESHSDAPTLNLNQLLDTGMLLKILGKFIQMKESYEIAVIHLDLKEFPVCNYMGYSVETWIEDIEFRIKLLINSTQITKPEESKRKLETFLSEEDRLSATLLDISKLL